MQAYFSSRVATAKDWTALTPDPWPRPNGPQNVCAILSDDTVRCWGDNRFGQSTPPDGVFTELAFGEADTCGLRPDGTVTCWGGSTFTASPPEGEFQAIASGQFRTFGLRMDGTAACWGDNRLRADGSIECWGFSFYGATEAPSGAFEAISAGYRHACGLLADGRAECWGAKVRPPQ